MGCGPAAGGGVELEVVGGDVDDDAGISVRCLVVGGSSPSPSLCLVVGPEDLGAVDGGWCCLCWCSEAGKLCGRIKLGSW